MNWFHLIWIYLVVGARFLRWRLGYRWRSQHERESNTLHMKQTLLFVRHGQTAWNVEHRLPGQLPGVALTEMGHQQAARLASALSALPISAIISSPLERAYMTAEYLARERNLKIHTEPDLMDTDVGPWAGQTIDALTKSDPNWKAYVKDPTVAPEGIETFPQVQKRVTAAVERWCSQEQYGSYLVFVAHADVIKLLVAYYSGLETGRAGSLFIDNASVSIVEVDQQHPAHIVSIGWSPQPGWLKPPVQVPSPQIDQEQETGEQKT